MGVLFLLGVDVVEEILMRLGGTKIILLLVKVAFHGEGILGNILETRLADSPGHDVKCPLLMAEMKVELPVMKAAE